MKRYNLYKKDNSVYFIDINEAEFHSRNDNEYRVYYTSGDKLYYEEHKITDDYEDIHIIYVGIIMFQTNKYELIQNLSNLQIQKDDYTENSHRYSEFT